MKSKMFANIYTHSHRHIGNAEKSHNTTLNWQFRFASTATLTTVDKEQKESGFAMLNISLVFHFPRWRFLHLARRLSISNHKLRGCMILEMYHTSSSSWHDMSVSLNLILMPCSAGIDLLGFCVELIFTSGLFFPPFISRLIKLLPVLIKIIIRTALHGLNEVLRCH